jgi:hypothetical protein
MSVTAPARGTSKVFIQHLDAMKPLKFLDLVKMIETNLNGVLTHNHVKINEKIDGSALRFGMDDRNKFFMESATSPPMFYTGDFEKMARAKGYTNHIGAAFDELLYLMKNDLDITDILRKYSENGIKIVGEVLSPRLANKSDALTTTFVRIPYHTHRLGRVWTFVPFMVFDGDGNRHQYEDTIIGELLCISNADRRYVHPMANMMGMIDLRHEIVALNYAIGESNVTYAMSILKSRKKADKPMKADLIELILVHQKRFAQVILDRINGGIFGPYFEGIVLEFEDKSIVKITTPEFKSLPSTL